MEPPAPVAGPLPHWLADEVALLLVAEQIDVEVVSEAGGAYLVVPARERARALRIIAEEYPQGIDQIRSREAAGRTRATAPVGGAERTADRWFGRASWVLFLIAAVTTGVFIAEERAGGSDARAVLLRFGAARGAHVRAGEWWRLVTALFVHIGPRHLLANLATLLVLGPALAAALGAGRFAFVYVVAGAAGNALSYQVTPSDVVSAGASGAILGVLGALGGQRLRFARSARYRGWQVVAAILAYLAIAVGASPEVDTAAHVGGLAAGFVLGLVIPPAGAVPNARDRLLGVICGALALLLAVAAFAALAASAHAGRS